MTADNPCNCERHELPYCGNCPIYETTPHPIHDADLHYCGKERVSIYQFDCTKHKGCLSHPKAREYLMRDVVEELERRSVDYRNDAEKKLWCGYSIKAAGLDEAITLIKGGVRK